MCTGITKVIFIGRNGSSMDILEMSTAVQNIFFHAPVYAWHHNNLLSQIY